MIVGIAEVLVKANTAGFAREVESQTAPAFGKVSKDAELAGESAGMNLRSGVTKHTGKLASDLEKDGAKAGEGLHKGLAPGLEKVHSGLAGLPITPLQALGAAAVVTAGAGIHLAESMQSADAAIAAAAGTSVVSAEKIGNAFLSTGGKSEFSAQQMATAFASVAGQLKATAGHALSAKQALQFESAAAELATAKQIDLGTASKATATAMQAFHLQAGQAAHVTDVLYSASTATGQSVDTLSTQLGRVRAKLGETAGPVGDLAGLLVDMTNQGITGRAAIGALSTGMSGLVKPTKAAAAEQKALGLEVFDAHGKFVGLGSIISQLNPKFANMTQQQQLQTAATLFGAGAARQMLSVIQAGPSAYDRATQSVNRHGSAQTAAAKQAQTLHGQEALLKAEVIDLATRIGTVLIPIITSMVGWFVKATTFVASHKAALIALAAVVTGILGPAIAVFTINKMASFVHSFQDAAGHVKQFASTVESVVSRVISAFTKQNTAATTMGNTVKTQAAKAGTASAAEATEVEASSAAVDTSFAGEATAAGAMATEVGVAETAAAGEVAAADSAIETDNAAAGASFTAIEAGATAALGALTPLLGALGVASLGVVGGNILGNAISGGAGVTPGSSPSNPLPNSPTSGGGIGGPGGAVLHFLGIGASGGIVDKPTLALIGESGREAVVPLDMVASVRHGHPLPGAGQLHAALGSSGGSSSAGLLAVHVASVAPSVHMDAARASIAAAGLSPNQIRAIAYEAGFRGSALTTAVQIAEAESSGNPSARYNPGSWEDSRGLWQINVAASANPQYARSNLYDPLTNARIAYAMSHGGADWNPWTTYTSGRYRSEPGGSGTPGPVVHTPPPRTIRSLLYANPLPGLTSVGRTDQGVDYSARAGSAVDAIGAGVITKIVADWYAGQPLVLEKLTQGPKAGQYVYYAEQLRALVREGQAVRAGQQIGTVASSGTGLELGFGSPNTSHFTLATAPGHGGYTGGPTAEGLAFRSFFGSIGSGVYTTSTVGGGSYTTLPALTAAQKLMAQVAAQQVAMEKLAARELAGAHTAAQKKAARHKIALQWAALELTVGGEEEKAGLLTGPEKTRLNKQTKDANAATKELGKLLADIHKGSLKALTGDLDKTHTKALHQLERSLDGDHNVALRALSQRLVVVHKDAMAALVKAIQKAADAKETAALTHGDPILADQAKRNADKITDATKIYLDQQAETGLTGAALVAAQAQSTLDTVTAAANQAIDSAQIAVDQAAGGSALAQALAAHSLAEAQAAATVNEALAQSALDLAAASAQSNPGGGVGQPIVLNIYGNGQMTAAQLFQEAGWAIRTGALPVATPA